MIEQIQARTLLSSVRQPDPIFGLRYNMNLYRGCQHRCIYCDSRSQCYKLDTFDRQIQIKVNALDLLEKELSRKRVKGTIGTGSMNDPYMPLEAERCLTHKALEIIARWRFPVHVITKSSLVQRDAGLLAEIGRVYSAVSFTITTADDSLAARLEPGAQAPSERFRALEELAAHGIYTGVCLMPVLPFITDSEDNIRAILEQAANSGASYVIAWMGMTLRDRQRDYFYSRLDERFPGLRRYYEQAFGDRYDCVSPNAKRLNEVLQSECDRLGLATKIRPFQEASTQPRLI